MARVFVKKGKARPFWYRHPWVFSGAVDRVEGDVRDGDVVTVADVDGSFIGAGFYNSSSQIRVRILSHRSGQTVDPSFFEARLDRAVALREKILRLGENGTTGYRLVHGEGDGLSGVAIDRYGDHIVIQFSAIGAKQREDLFFDYLSERFRPMSIYENANFPYRDAEGLRGESGVRRGAFPSGDVTFQENGLDLLADLRLGQKTGYYLDQRINRQTVASHAAGRTMLDAFCYAGGFALHAARAGARHVVAVDSSGAAVALGNRTAQLNQLQKQVHFVEADVNTYLAEARNAGTSFGVVVLDPPKYAVAKKDQINALHRYRDLNAAAMRLVERDGLLATSSCSYHVSAAEFEIVLNEAAKHANRFLQILHCAGQAPDHPVSSACLEGCYLKFVLARVC